MWAKPKTLLARKKRAVASRSLLGRPGLRPWGSKGADGDHGADGDEEGGAVAGGAKGGGEGIMPPVTHFYSNRY